MRHRVAQYYCDAGREGEIRIELAPGSYVPQFRRPAAVAGERAGCPTPDERVAPPAVVRPRLRWRALAAGVVVLGALAWFLFARWAAPDAVSEFWGPVWDNSNAIVICVPGNFPTPENPTQTSGVAVPDRPPSSPLNIRDSLGLNSITWPDATVLYSLTGFLAHYRLAAVYRELGRATDARREAAAFSEIRDRRNRITDVYRQMHKSLASSQLADPDVPQ